MGASDSKEPVIETKHSHQLQLGEFPQNPKLETQLKPRSIFAVSIPKELLQYLSSFLEDQDVLHFSQTCKTAYNILSEDLFWDARLLSMDISDFEQYEPHVYPSVKYWYFYQRKLDTFTLKKHDGEIVPHTFVILLGNDKVGKTHLRLSLMDRKYKQDTHPNQVNCFLSTLQQHEFGDPNYGKTDVTYYEIPGNMPVAYQDILRPFQVARFVLFMYSVADRESFDAVEKFYQESLACTMEVTRMLVSTHNDLPKEKHQVTSEEAKSWAKEHNTLFVETSVITRRGIKLLKKIFMQVCMEKNWAIEKAKEPTKGQLTAYAVKSVLTGHFSNLKYINPEHRKKMRLYDIGHYIDTDPDA